MSSPEQQNAAVDNVAMEVDDNIAVEPTAEASTSSTTQNATKPAECVMAGPAIVPSVTISLHPLVIMNISEHWTRIRAQGGQPAQVIGALIGTQSGRNIEVMNSFELKFKILDGEILIDMEYYNTKEGQYKQVFKDLEFLGWYTTGNEPNESDINVHKQICVINECPILLKLSPQSRNFDQLPVRLYESIIDLVHGDTKMLFVNLPYTLATEEAERIGVDHVARMSSHESSGKSIVAEHLTAQHSAIKMLHSRVKLILLYINSVMDGRLEANQEILREAYALSQRLPVIQTSQFHEEYYTQSNDVGLITFLGTLTKGCNEINHFVNKYNILYDRQGSRRMRGLYF